MKFRPALFWDVDPKTIDPKKHAKYIIERVLDFGNDKEVKAVWQEYPRLFIKNLLNTSRILRPETKNLWSLLLKSKNH